MILDSIHFSYFTCLLKPLENQSFQHATSDPQLSKNGPKPAAQSTTAQNSKDSRPKNIVKWLAQKRSGKWGFK